MYHSIAVRAPPVSDLSSLLPSIPGWLLLKPHPSNCIGPNPEFGSLSICTPLFSFGRCQLTKGLLFRVDASGIGTGSQGFSLASGDALCVDVQVGTQSGEPRVGRQIASIPA